MPRDYKVFVHLECLDSLPRSGKARQTLDRFIRDLAHSAHTGGDFVVVDPETTRRFEVSLVAGHAVTWWIDGPVDEVKIVDIRVVPLERR